MWWLLIVLVAAVGKSQTVPATAHSLADIIFNIVSGLLLLLWLSATLVVAVVVTVVVIVAVGAVVVAIVLLLK